MKELKIQKVSKSFKGIWVIREVTANFLPKHITGLIGPNGAGKTTIFHLITGELIPDAGDIIYNGKSIRGFYPWQIARLGIGRMFQDVRIFSGLSVLENVMVSLYSPKEETPYYAFKPFKKDKKEDAFKWLEFVDLKDEYNKKAEELSYGQQKLLALARLLAANYTLILLDEPIAGVSPVITKKILKLLKDLVDKYQKTVIVIEHNMNIIIDITDWVYFMSEGSIYFSGKPNDVLGAKEVRKLYLGIA